MSLLSIVIPARNEQAFLETLLGQVNHIKLPPDWESEILIINDNSTDATPQIAENFANTRSGVTVIHNDPRLGKTQSVKKGILSSRGDVVVIQDADLEYDPNELPPMLEKMIAENLDVVYGDRFGLKNKVIYYQNYYGNKLVSMFSNIFTYPRIRVWIPDMEVCYKMVKGDVIREIAATISATSNFGLEPEVTAKLSKYKLNGKHLKFGLVPIHYMPRSAAEGKKLKAFQDGFKAVKEIIYYNLFAK